MSEPFSNACIACYLHACTYNMCTYTKSHSDDNIITCAHELQTCDDDHSDCHGLQACCYHLHMAMVPCILSQAAHDVICVMSCHVKSCTLSLKVRNYLRGCGSPQA